MQSYIIRDNQERNIQIKRENGLRERAERGRRIGGISLSQGKALRFPCAVTTDTHTHRSTSAPQMSSTGTTKGQGTPSPSTLLYVWVLEYMLPSIYVCVNVTAAKYFQGGDFQG